MCNLCGRVFRTLIFANSAVWIAVEEIRGTYFGHLGPFVTSKARQLDTFPADKASFTENILPIEGAVWCQPS